MSNLLNPDPENWTGYAAVDFFGIGILDVSGHCRTDASWFNQDSWTGQRCSRLRREGAGRGSYGRRRPGRPLELDRACRPWLVLPRRLLERCDGIRLARLRGGRADGTLRLRYLQSQPLEPVTTVQSARAPSSVEVPATSGAETSDIVCMVGGGFLQVYDVSDPAQPVKMAEIRMPSGRPLRVTVKGRLAYVADGPAGLQVVDLTKPSEPTIVSTYPVASRARDITVTDSHVFVVVGEGEGDEEGEILILHQTPYHLPHKSRHSSPLEYSQYSRSLRLVSRAHTRVRTAPISPSVVASGVGCKDPV